MSFEGSSSEHEAVEASPQVAFGVEPDSVDLLAAALRHDAADLETYERVLVSTLASALPDGMVEVERDRSFADRVAGRPGVVRAIRAHFGEVALELTSRRGALIGVCSREVRGVVINRKEVNFEEWTHLFAVELARVATEHASAATALARFLGTN